MNYKQRKERIQQLGLTRCYECNKEIDFNDLHMEHEYFNGQRMDVRLECWNCHIITVRKLES